MSSESNDEDTPSLHDDSVSDGTSFCVICPAIVDFPAFEFSVLLVSNLLSTGHKDQAHKCLNFLKSNTNWSTTCCSLHGEMEMTMDLENVEVEMIEPETEIEHIPIEKLVKHAFQSILGISQNQIVEVSEKREAKVDMSDVVVEKFNISIRRCDLESLMPNKWVNDEIINYYMQLLMERSSETLNLPITYVFSTFFYVAYSSRGYAGVQKWTRNVDIFANDLLLFPIHLDLHWVMVAVNLPKKTIVYYDSLGLDGAPALKTIAQYLNAESSNRGKGLNFSDRSWQKCNAENIPQQINGDDCGVFMLKFADLLSRNEEVTFDENDAIGFRYQIAVEILQKHLL